MKYRDPVNPNYVATVIRVGGVEPLEGLDNLVALRALGYQALVSKDTKPGDIGVLFTAESQLSHDFVSANNLYRHSDLNSDTSLSGYIEDSRRVKAIKLRGHRSDALFVKLDSFAYLGLSPEDFGVGDTFDFIGDQEIVRKYVIRQSVPVNKSERQLSRIFRRVDKKMLPEHIDTDNYWRNAHLLSPNKEIVVTQKLHGTSIRIGRVPVLRKLNLRERIAKRLGVAVKEWEYDAVFGSRKVIKDVHNPYQDHWYGVDLWSEVGERYADLIPEGFIIYGEVIGWVDGDKPIQVGYTYDLAPGENELYVYRVAQINPSGILTDLSWDRTVDFCRDIGLKTVPEIGRWSTIYYFNVDELMDLRYFEEMPGFGLVPLSDGKTVDEGVVIRQEARVPILLKAKSPIFLQHESKLLDSGNEDVESSQGGE